MIFTSNKKEVVQPPKSKMDKIVEKGVTALCTMLGGALAVEHFVYKTERGMKAAEKISGLVK